MSGSASASAWRPGTAEGETMKGIMFGILAAAALTALPGCEPVAEPWVPGEQAELLEKERTRTDEQKNALRERLRQYGGAYQ